MFHFLTDELPDSINLKGIDYRINTDYRYYLSLFRLVYNTDESFLFTDIERMQIAIDLIYIDMPPFELLEEAYKEIFRFIDLYQDKDIGSTNEQAPAIFDYMEDSMLIYSAFYQQYHIDLIDTDMHWFKFYALLNNINDGKPTLVSVMDIRSLRDSEIRKYEPDEQIRIRKLKKKLSLKSAEGMTFNAEREKEIDKFMSGK